MSRLRHVSLACRDYSRHCKVRDSCMKQRVAPESVEGWRQAPQIRQRHSHYEPLRQAARLGVALIYFAAVAQHCVFHGLQWESKVQCVLLPPRFIGHCTTVPPCRTQHPPLTACRCFGKSRARECGARGPCRWSLTAGMSARCRCPAPPALAATAAAHTAAAQLLAAARPANRPLFVHQQAG